MTVRPAGSSRAGVPRYASSSRLEVEFRPIAEAVHHYRIVARDASGGPAIGVRAAQGATRATLSGLRSDASYAVDLTACHDA